MKVLPILVRAFLNISLVYAVFWFVSFEPDPLAWGENGRFFFILVVASFSVPIELLYQAIRNADRC